MRKEPSKTKKWDTGVEELPDNLKLAISIISIVGSFAICTFTIYMVIQFLLNN